MDDGYVTYGIDPPLEEMRILHANWGQHPDVTLGTETMVFLNVIKCYQFTTYP